VHRNWICLQKMTYVTSSKLDVNWSSVLLQAERLFWNCVTFDWNVWLHCVYVIRTQINCFTRWRQTDRKLFIALHLLTVDKRANESNLIIRASVTILMRWSPLKSEWWSFALIAIKETVWDLKQFKLMDPCAVQTPVLMVWMTSYH
jgi:hypothetical protein